MPAKTNLYVKNSTIEYKERFKSSKKHKLVRHHFHVYKYLSIAFEDAFKARKCT